MRSLFLVQKASCSASYRETKTYKFKSPTSRFTTSWENIKPPETMGKALLALHLRCYLSKKSVCSGQIVLASEHSKSLRGCYRVADTVGF